MLTWIKRLFAPPALKDEEEVRLARLLIAVLNALLGIVLIGGVAMISTGPANFFANWVNPAIIGGVAALTLALQALTRRGAVRLAGLLLSVGMLGAVTLAVYDYGGVDSPAIAGYFLCIVIAGLLLGGWGAAAFAAAAVFAAAALWYAGRSGLLPPYRHDPAGFFYIIAYTMLFTIGGVLLYYAANSVTRALDQARRNERAQAQANRELEALRASLQDQVAGRTQALERRTAQLQAAAEVGRAAAVVLEPERLARRVVELVCERFGLYYAGLFIVDEAGEWAVLRTGAGQRGRELLTPGYRVSLGSDSIISQSIVSGQARVAVEAEGMSGALSGAALPLHSRGRAIGALFVYSDQPDTFDRDTMTVLETAAELVAVALDNARLFAQSQAALEAARRAYGELGRQAWAELARVRPDLSLRRGKSGVAPAGAPPPQVKAALHTGQATPGPQAALAAPIKVRDQVIGALDARKLHGAGDWTDQEAALLQTLADQLGLALESARLYQDTQRRAAQEQLIGEVTARMRESLDVDAVLQTAAREFGQVLGLPEVYIHLAEAPGDNAARAP